MKKLYMWTARRAGGRITINGFDAEGAAVKVVGVDVIESGKDGASPIATDKDGERYELA